MQFDSCVDAQGLACPMPLLKAKLALNQLPGGAVLKVIATDAGAERDIPSFARLAGHQLVHKEQAGGQFIFYLRKKQEPSGIV